MTEDELILLLSREAGGEGSENDPIKKGLRLHERARIKVHFKLLSWKDRPDEEGIETGYDISKDSC